MNIIKLILLLFINTSIASSSEFVKLCKNKKSPKEIKKTIGYLKRMVQKTFSVKNVSVKSEYHLDYKFPRYEFAKKELYDYNRVESFLLSSFNDNSISCEKVRERLAKLKTLEMATVPPKKIAMDRLKRKTWTIKGITDISPLAEFTNLEYIHIGQNSIRSIEPLKGMTKLKVLKMGKNDIEDVSPLANLKELQVLELFENMIEDITPLKSLNNLEYLSVFGNYLGSLVKHSKMSSSKKKAQEKENLKTFNSLTKLKFLGASVNGFATIEHFNEAKSLRYLNMSNNRIRDISNLKKMSNLKYLVLKKNYLTSIDSVKNLRQLVSLKLSGDHNLIKCWAPLASLSKITKSAYFSINHKIGGVANRKVDGLDKGDEYTCIQCPRRAKIRSQLIKNHCRGLGKYSQYFCEERPFDFCIQRNCNKVCKKVAMNKKGICRKKCRKDRKGDVFKMCKKDFKQECR